jgi:hypothetical protein
VLVIHRHPGAESAVHDQCARRDLGVEREEEVGEAPVVGILFRWAVGAVAGAEFRVSDGVARRPLLDLVVQEVALVGIF